MSVYRTIGPLVMKYRKQHSPRCDAAEHDVSSGAILFILLDIGKQHSARCDATERSIPSGAILFA